MATIWWFCVPVLLATMTMAIDISPEVIDYTTSLIHYLSEQEPGSFDCWFYEHTTSAVSGLSVLDPIVSSEKLALVPKRILYSVGRIKISRLPSVLVMFCEEYKSAKELLVEFFLAYDFDQFMKIIVFSESEQFVKILHVFKVVSMFEVVFIRTDSLLFGQYLLYRNRFTERSGFVSFDEVFVDQARDLAGYVVKVSTFRPRVIVTYEMMERMRISEWIVDAVRALNGSYDIHTVGYGTVDEIGKNLFNFNGKIFDFSIDKLSASKVQNPFFMFSYLLGTYGMLVPRGRQLRVIEIFLAPFMVEVWIVLLVVIIFGSLITKIWSNLFQNDIILLSLCGIECRDLNRTSLPEKMIITSLTVLFFILTHAYEAKMISHMTSSPYLPDPRTLDDLIRNNITVQHVSINDTALIDTPNENPKWLQVFRYNPTRGRIADTDPQDPHQAYVGELINLKFNAIHPKNLDPTTGRTIFQIMESFTGFTTLVHLVRQRSPLKRQLVRIEKALFEAGILHFLQQKMFGT